jgi:ribosomal protein S6--L-glutamate ligase
VILSYHPILEGDVNRLCAGREPDEADFEAMRRASAILLPQACRRSLYEAARRSCPHVFPNYDRCFRYPGKSGDIQLFRDYTIPHPQSHLFPAVEACSASFWRDIHYPVVVKSNYGGEGTLVFKLDGPEGAQPILEMFQGMERSGLCGFIVQEWIPTDGRDLRVVIMGERFHSYWRVQKDPGNFYHNVSKGAEIDTESDPLLQEIGIGRVREFSSKTGINLAGLDLMFSFRDGSICSEPLFLEINYYFGRKGLGGLENYYRLLREAADEWLQKTLKNDSLSCHGT